jgi:molybdate transport system substrate-binding protein
MTLLRAAVACVLVLAAAMLGGCASPARPASMPVSGSGAREGELIVFAAASLTEAFTELGAALTAAHPGVRVIFNFGGSQQLAQQLAQGAPADLFASANRRQMAVAVDAGRVGSDTAQVFACNRLVVVYPVANHAGLATLHDLAAPGLKLVLAAPEVPVGGYARDFLDRAAVAADYGPAYSAAVLANVVSYEENVRAVLSKVVLGEADAGIVYASDVTLDAAEQVGRMAIPDALNTVAEYPVAPVVDAAHPALAQAFLDLLLGPEGQAILAKYGFETVAED